MWDHLSRSRLDGYIVHAKIVWRKVFHTLESRLELPRNIEWYLAHFKSANHTTCYNYDFLGIFREALQVNHMFERGYLPVLLHSI